jgi:hypothetical protein
MQKTIGLLAVLLAAQLALAVGMSLTGPELKAQQPDTPLLDLGEQTVDKITIEGSDNQKIAIVRKGQGWVLPAIGNFPADQSKVERLLEQLQGLKRGPAVATTEGALERFKVSDQDFERRLTLARDDETLATLYFGTSPGMRQVHARTSEDDAVYTARFGLYDAPVKAADWEDKAVLKIPADQIESISLAELTLRRANQSQNQSNSKGESASMDDAGEASDQTAWTAEPLEDDATVNQEKADGLARKLADLTVGSVLGREARPEYGLETPALTLTVKREDGKTIEYRLGKHDEGDDYVLKVSSRPEYFRVPGYTAKPLIEAVDREHLLASTDKTTDADATAQSPAESPPAKEAESLEQTESSAEPEPPSQAVGSEQEAAP